MSFKQPAIVLAAVALGVAAGAAPASAQAPFCGDLYNRVMMLYQTAPQSPEYSQVSAYYNANCLAGPPAGPAYPAPYYQPTPVDPGAAIVGGVIGGVIGGALEDDHDRRRERAWRREEWRERHR